MKKKNAEKKSEAFRTTKKRTSEVSGRNLKEGFGRKSRTETNSRAPRIHH
jgi:hypothetical protein